MGLDLGFLDSSYLPLLALALSFILCGIICLLCRRHILYICLVAIDALFWPAISILFGAPMGITHWSLLLPHIALLAYTIVRWKRLSLGKITKIVITVYLALVLALAIVSNLTPTQSPSFSAGLLDGTTPSSVAAQPIETT